MPAAHPPEVKAHALSLAQQGLGSSAIAAQTGLPQSTVYRYLAEEPSTAALLSKEVKNRRLVVAAKATAFTEDAVDVASARLHDADDPPTLYTALGAVKVAAAVADAMYFGPQAGTVVNVDARTLAVQRLAALPLDELQAEEAKLLSAEATLASAALASESGGGEEEDMGGAP